MNHDRFERLLGAVGGVVVHRPWFIIVLFGMLTLASVVVTSFGLELETGRNSLISSEMEYNQRYLRYREEFGDREHIYVVIPVRHPGSTRGLEAAKAIADEVAKEVSGLPGIASVHHRVPLQDVRERALLFLSEAELLSTAAAADAQRELLGRAFAARGLPEFLDVLTDLLGEAARDPGSPLASVGAQALSTVVGLLRASATGRVSIPPPEHLESVEVLARRWLPALARGNRAAGEPTPSWVRDLEGDGYFYTGSLLFVMILPEKDYGSLEIVREPLRRIREALSKIRKAHPGHEIGLTGRPVLNADEMETTNVDMTRGVIGALLGGLILFVIFFRALRRPVLTALALGAGIAITFGLVTLAIGHLNLLSIVFAVMLVSLGMEFGIHVLARYQEELERCGEIGSSMQRAIVTAGKGNVTGSVTTAAAFFAALAIDFQGLSELGVIAGSGVLICMLVMNTLLPALVVVSDRWRLPRGHLGPVSMGALELFTRRPWLVLGACAVFSLVVAPGLASFRFDSNLLDLQARELPSVQWELRIIQDPEISTWHAAIVRDDLAGVRDVVSRLRTESDPQLVGRWESILDFVPEQQSAKREILARIGITLEQVREGAARTESPLVGDAMVAAVERLLDRLDELLSGTLRGQGEGAELLERVTDDLDRLLAALEAAPEQAIPRLAALQSASFAVRQAAGDALQGMLATSALDIADWPRMIRERVISSSGRHVVTVYPARDIWSEGNMTDFIEAVRKIDPEATGETVQVHESTRIMKRGFVVAGLYSLVAVFLLILLDFRRLTYALLAMAPLLLGLGWLFATLPYTGVSLNLANFFAIPIIIGVGINDGVHMIHRFREERSVVVATRSTGAAVVLSSFTTMAGFGMLLMARHQGVATLGAVMVLGVAWCLVATVLVLPALLSVLERRRHVHE